MVFVPTTQCCHCSQKEAMANTETKGHDCTPMTHDL